MNIVIPGPHRTQCGAEPGIHFDLHATHESNMDSGFCRNDELLVDEALS